MHTADDAEAILAPHMPALGALYPDAFADFEEFVSARPDLPLHPRTRACIVNDCAERRAWHLFGDLAPNVTLHDSTGVLYIIFHAGESGWLRMRLNKFKGDSLHMGGIPTQQRLRFGSQEPLTGMPNTTSVVLGYHLDLLHTAIERVAVSCSIHESEQWAIDVPMPGEDERPVSLPSEPQGPPDPSFREERDEEEEDREEGEGADS